MNFQTYDEDGNHVQIVNKDYAEYSNSAGEGQYEDLFKNQIDFDAVYDTNIKNLDKLIAEWLHD